MPKSATDLTRLWERAVPMQHAAPHFAPPDLRAEWEAANRRSAIEAFQKGADAAADSDAPGWEKLQQAFSGSQAILARRSEIMEQMRSKLLVHLYSGALLGFGFEFPRSVEKAPLELVPAYWRGQCLWEKSELRAQSLHFVEVRVLSAQRAAALLASIEAPPTPSRKQGRPSLKPAIEDAVQALKDAGAVDTGRSMRSHFPLVRAWLREHRPEIGTAEDSPDDETIRRVFQPIFKASKKL